MAITTWNPSLWDTARWYKNLPTRFLDEDDWDVDLFSPSNVGSVDVYEEGGNVMVEMRVPGFRKEDLEISVERDTLTIKADRTEAEEENKKKRKYYRKEIRHQSIARSIVLPTFVDSTKASADFKDGILKLTLPKQDAAKPKTIKIS
ncbi:MAG: Hsp20/alpha crystallin family protein [Patescibacteria group bacterium]